MSDKCYFCGLSLELDLLEETVRLCHCCYLAFADPESPFYHPAFVSVGFWWGAMSEPSAKMWVQNRLENY